MKKFKKFFAVILSAVIVSSVFSSVFAVNVGAEEVQYPDHTNSGEKYEIYNDGYGYLSANFPDVYPEEYITVESDTLTQSKINAILDTVTTEEKIDMLAASGVRNADTSSMASYFSRHFGTGTWVGCARVGVPMIRCYDGPTGVRSNTGYESTKPSNENSVASSFDTETAYEYGLLVGRDNKADGGNMQLGDQLDLVRQLSTGRANDMYGEDWFLAGSIGSAFTKGLQDENVIACLKHIGGIGNVDEQTLHENYLSVFEMAVKDGGAGAFMTNYNTTNGKSACSDSYTLKTVLRDMWDFDGIVLTDWGGNYSFTVDDGVTIETPDAAYNNSENINYYLKAGLITMDDINEAVSYNLKALAEVGYLGMVQVGRDGKAAVDSDPPAYIDLEVTDGADRETLIEENNEKAIEIAEKGMVLVRNEDNALPLKEDENIALIGPDTVYQNFGGPGEQSSGALIGNSVSLYDALTAMWPNSDISGYVTEDAVGTPIDAEYLYVDENCTENGVIREGTDGYGNEDNSIDADINYVTNSLDYKNAEDGKAFPYGDQGASYTFTTYLKAPESGTYTFKLEGMAAYSTFEASIEVNGEEKYVNSATGNLSYGGFANSSYVTDTGLDIPSTGSSGGGGMRNPFSDVPNMTDAEIIGKFGPGTQFESIFGTGDMTDEEIVEFAWKMYNEWMATQNPSSQRTTTSEFTLEEGKVYKITVKADGNIKDAYYYQRAIKDMQVSLAWITPSQKTANYKNAMTAASTPGTTVVFVADAVTYGWFKEAFNNAVEAGNKIVLLLTSKLPVEITDIVDNCDAIIQVWSTGQAGGPAMANVITGAYNPSGKLDVAWPKSQSYDQSSIVTSGRGLATGEPNANNITTSEIKEGIYNGYKWYDATDTNENLLYDFGYGLSYTTFDYDLVSVTPSVDGVDEYGYDFEIKVTNTGDVAGSDAPQIYIAAPEEGLVENAVYDPYTVADSWTYVDEDGNPITEDVASAAYFPEIDGVQFADVQLAGYAHTDVIEPGESETVTIHVDQRSLSYWDTSISDDDMYVRSDGTQDKWTVVEGERTFYVAKSSDDFVAEETIEVSKSTDVVTSVNAPESAEANDTFVVELTTGTDVIGVKLENESGKTITVKRVVRTFNENSISWKVYTSVGTAGDRTISLYTKTYDGYSDTAIAFNIKIVDPPVEVYTAAFDVTEIGVNEKVGVTVNSSSSVKNIKIFNENNGNMGKKLVTKSMNSDGSIVWNYTMSFGSKGIAKIYRFVGYDKNGESGVSAARTYIDVV